MKLRKLLRALDDDLPLYNGRKMSEIPDIDIKSVADNSRDCIPGALFAPLRGAVSDGADYIDDAWRRGATLFLTDRELPIPDGAYTLRVTDAHAAYTRLLLRFLGDPLDGMTVIAVTGTKGKSTVCSLLSFLLEYRGIKNVAVGTLGAHGAGISEKTVNTTPTASYLCRLAARARRRGASALIVEMSSQALKYRRLAGLPVDIAVLTGIGCDHTDPLEHPDFADYIASKRRLFTDYGAAVAFAPSDDPFTPYITFGMNKIVTYGIKSRADYRVKQITLRPDGSEFSLRGSRFFLPIPGEFNAADAAAALAVASRVCACPPGECAPALRTAAVPGRFEVRQRQGRRVIVDYAHNYVSVSSVCSLVRSLFPGRITALFGSVGGRAHGRRRELAAAAERFADFSVITSDTPGAEERLALCAERYAAYRDKTRAAIVVSRPSAVAYALRATPPGGTVLLLGKGDETYTPGEGGDGIMTDKNILYMLDNAGALC